MYFVRSAFCRYLRHFVVLLGILSYCYVVRPFVGVAIKMASWSKKNAYGVYRLSYTITGIKMVS